MSNYINNLADSRLKGDNEQNDMMLQAHYFDRNNLRGSKTELNNQLKDITAQVDYGRAPPQSRPTIIDKLNEGNPQDKLNERQYSLEISPQPSRGQENDAINPYIKPNQSAGGIKYGQECDYGNHFPYPPRFEHRRHGYEDWSLTKTIVIVIILLGIFYLLLNIIFQDHGDYHAVPGNMNLYNQPPSIETNQ